MKAFLAHATKLRHVTVLTKSMRNRDFVQPDRPVAVAVPIHWFIKVHGDKPGEHTYRTMTVTEARDGWGQLVRDFLWAGDPVALKSNGRYVLGLMHLDAYNDACEDHFSPLVSYSKYDVRDELDRIQYMPSWGSGDLARKSRAAKALKARISAAKAGVPDLATVPVYDPGPTSGTRGGHKSRPGVRK